MPGTTGGPAAAARKQQPAGPAARTNGMPETDRFVYPAKMSAVWNVAGVLAIGA